MALQENELMMTQHVLVVEDNHNVQKLNTQRLTALGYEVAAVSSELDAHQQWGKRQWAFVVLDVQLPETAMRNADDTQRGLTIAKRFRQANPNIPILFYSGYPATRKTISQVRDNLGDRALAFLMKERDGNQFEDAIHCILNGGVFLSPAFITPYSPATEEYLQREFEASVADQIKAVYERVSGLSIRELEVAYWTGKGLTVTAIANQLSIANQSVHDCRSKCYQILGIPSRDGPYNPQSFLGFVIKVYELEGGEVP
jgi:DNA-binding NarL/FixJ family response regulator